MPHFTIEYSANLDKRLDMAAAVEVVRKAAIETRKGDTIQADYGAYGSVSCYFA